MKKYTIWVSDGSKVTVETEEPMKEFDIINKATNDGDLPWGVAT